MTLSDKAMQKIDSLANSINDLITIHNEDEESHPDIRGLINNFKPTDITVITDTTEVTEDGIYILTKGPVKSAIFDVIGKGIELAPSNWMVDTSEMKPIVTSEVTIDWGDGTTTVIDENSNPRVEHRYYDGLSEHIVQIIGQVDKFGHAFFCLTPIKNLTLNGITELTIGMFTSSQIEYISIPASVTNIHNHTFYYAEALKKIDLYWTNEDILPYNYFPTNVTFGIPQGTTANYEAKGFPSSKLVERE